MTTSDRGHALNQNMSAPRLLERLDPRRSLAGAIGWSLAAVFLIGAYAASYWAGELARGRLESQTGALYKQYALQISNVLDNNLYDRLQWIRAMAQLFATNDVEQSVDRQRLFLERMKASLPDFDWIGFAGPDGIVLAATDHQRERESVTDQSWFAAGREREWIGDVHVAPLVEQPAPSMPAIEARRVIDLTAPVRDSSDRLLGVIGSHLAWAWTTKLEASLTEGLKSRHVVESLIVDRAGKVILGPPEMLGTLVPLPGDRPVGAVGHLVHRWPDGREYVAGFAVSDGMESFPGLGWTVWVREPVESAFADARALERRIFLGMLMLGVVGAVVSMLVARRLTRGLSTIAHSADRIRHGEEDTLIVPPGADEAARIGQSLRTLVDGLQAERSALRSLNAELDARVAARTREVERMSEENKYAAVVRERLRMARDLHDTLAHSMMALLTEIRLLRKLADTSPATLKEELANAEAAAEEGLREARAAITALRHNAVRDIGLGASLAQLLKRFEERKGISVSFDCDAGVDALADSRAETIYRIIEEGVSNVDRHAQASHLEAVARVSTLEGDHADVLTVMIADDGVGFHTGSLMTGHYGIVGMHEQAALIGAQLELVSKPDGGTRLSLRMPL